jgi:large repetitive protein
LSAVAGSNSLAISSGTINAGSSCELAADVTTGAIGALTNQINPGNLTSAQGITNTNTTAATLVSSGTSDVSIVKSNSITQQTAGASTTYTIVVTNNSASIAVVGIPVNDNVPAGMTFSSWMCNASVGSSCAVASGIGAIATTVSLAKLGSATFSVIADLDAGFVGSTLSNTASINPAAAGISDTDATNDQAVDTDTVVQSANVSIAKTVSNPSPIVGEQVTFTLSVNNAGPSLANSVSVNDVLPAGYSFVSATPSVGGFTAPTWTIGPLAANGTATLQIIAIVNPTGPYVNTASVTSSTLDPVPGDNISSIGTTPLTANITVAKTAAAPTTANGVNPAISDAGDTVLYSFTVTNNGTAALNDVKPVDPGPLFNGQAGTGTMGGFVPGFVALAPGASQIFTATYTFSDLDVYRAAGVSGGVANTANASALTPSGSTITAVTSASASTNIVAQPSLSIVKTFVLNDLPGGTAGVADLGETILYTYTTANKGNTTINNVNITDNHETSSPVLTAAQIQGESLIVDGPLSLLAAPILSIDAGNNGFWDQLQPGATVVFTYLHTVTQDEVDGS